MVNKYALINTQFNQTDVTLIEQMNGRQGDSGRIVNLSIRDGNMPHDISNQTISVVAKDASGKIKIVSTVNNIISSVGGLFSMIMPSELYQASGDMQEAYVQISDANDTVVSSIPIMFTVVANNIIMTANASSDYIDSVQEAVRSANKIVAGLSDGIAAQSIAYASLQDALNTMIGAINSQQVAVKSGDNNFSGKNRFDGVVAFNGSVVFNSDAVFNQPISGRFLSKELADATDLFTLIDPGWHYIVRTYNNAMTMINKPADVRNAFSIDTTNISGYKEGSWAGTQIKLTEYQTGNSYTANISRDNMGIITSPTGWRKVGDGTTVSKVVIVNNIPFTFTRIGNLVSVTMHVYNNVANTRYAADMSQWAAAGTIPNGYKPTALVRIPAGHEQGAKADGSVSAARDGSLAIDIDGSMYTRIFDMPLPLNGAAPRMDAAGTYMTFDSYPAI